MKKSQKGNEGSNPIYNTIWINKIPRNKLYFLKILFIYIQRDEKGEREGEKHPCVRETSIAWLSHTPNWGPGPQPRHVPWWGIKLVTFWFTGQHATHWATPARCAIKGHIWNHGHLIWRFGFTDNKKKPSQRWIAKHFIKQEQRESKNQEHTSPDRKSPTPKHTCWGISETAFRVRLGEVPSAASFPQLRFQSLPLGAVLNYVLDRSGYTPRDLCDLVKQQVPLGEGTVLPGRQLPIFHSHNKRHSLGTNRGGFRCPFNLSGPHPQNHPSAGGGRMAGRE